MLPNLGPMEMLVVMGIAVLLFGKRLPEVGRSLGKGIVEFKKGLRGIEDELDYSSGSSPRFEERRHNPSPHHGAETSVPKFEPPTTAPVPRKESQSHPTQD